MLGIFDSGLGGLTVVRAIDQVLPGTAYTYLGDTARLPYGTKTPTTVARYTRDALNFLHQRGATTPIVACHTASSVLVGNPKLRADITEQFGTEPYDVVTAGLAAVRAQSKSDRVGILATTATVHSGVYEMNLHEYVVTQVPASVLVGLAEEGWVEPQHIGPILETLLMPFLRAEVDTVVLACTHFPILTQNIRDILGRDVVLIDPGVALANHLAKTPHATGEQQFFATDIPDDFAERSERFLGRPITAEHV